MKNKNNYTRLSSEKEKIIEAMKPYRVIASFQSVFENHSRDNSLSNIIDVLSLGIALDNNGYENVFQGICFEKFPKDILKAMKEFIFKSGGGFNDVVKEIQGAINEKNKP